jgi:internalin A
MINLQYNKIRSGEKHLVNKSTQEIVRYCRDTKEDKLDFVTVGGIKYYVFDDVLNLSELGIRDIEEIKGLENLSNLKELNLYRNQISEIKGLENLINLQRINLDWNFRIEGGEKHLVNKSAQEIVKYCRDKKEGKFDFVTVGGIKYYVVNNILDLSGIIISDFSEIKGFETLTYLEEFRVNNYRHHRSRGEIKEIKGLEHLINLRILDLGGNQIEEIKGLDKLINLEKLNLSYNRITEIKGLDTLVNLKELNCHTNHIREIKGLENLVKLQALNLYYNRISEIKGLENLINLKIIDLGYNNWIRREERYLLRKNAQEIVKFCQDKKQGKFPFVTIRGSKYYAFDNVLDLSRRRITDIAEIEGLEKLKNLIELNLSENQINEIKGLENLKNLQILNLNRNPLGAGDKRIGNQSAQEIVKYCQDKKEGQLPFVSVEGKKYYIINDILDLSGVGITAISKIIGLENFSNLKELDLRGNEITEIEGLNHLSNLQELYLDYNQIKEIKGLEHLTNLQKLGLNGNQIEEIKGLEHLMKLQNLYLHDNPIRAGEKHLVNKSAQKIVKYCRGKKKGNLAFVTIEGQKYYVMNNELNLSFCGISDIIQIKRLETLSNLKKLDLSHNKIEEIKGLEILTNIKILNLQYNKISEIEGLEKFENLQELSLDGNPLKGADRLFMNKNAQEIVKYCQDKKEGKFPFVTFRGIKYYVLNNELNFKSFGINDITEIEGLEALSNLKKLDLSHNKIKKIEGLEHLINLKELNFYWNDITEIGGLDALKNLQIFNFQDNKI